MSPEFTESTESINRESKSITQSNWLKPSHLPGTPNVDGDLETVVVFIGFLDIVIHVGGKTERVSAGGWRPVEAHVSIRHLAGRQRIMFAVADLHSVEKPLHVEHSGGQPTDVGQLGHGYGLHACYRWRGKAYPAHLEVRRFRNIDGDLEAVVVLVGFLKEGT